MQNTKIVVSRKKAILKAFSYTFCELVGVVFTLSMLRYVARDPIELWNT